MIPLNGNPKEAIFGGFYYSDAKNEKLIDNFSFSNPPELNDLRPTIPQPSVDYFAFVMTISMLEIGLDEFYREIDADKLNKNYNNFYWR